MQRKRFAEVMGDFAEDSDGTIDSNSSEFYLRQERSSGIPYRKRFKAVDICKEFGTTMLMLSMFVTSKDDGIT